MARRGLAGTSRASCARLRCARPLDAVPTPENCPRLYNLKGGDEHRTRAQRARCSILHGRHASNRTCPERPRARWPPRRQALPLGPAQGPRALRTGARFEWPECHAQAAVHAGATPTVGAADADLARRSARCHQRRQHSCRQEPGLNGISPRHHNARNGCHEMGPSSLWEGHGVTKPVSWR